MITTGRKMQQWQFVIYFLQHYLDNLAARSEKEEARAKGEKERKRNNGSLGEEEERNQR